MRHAIRLRVSLVFLFFISVYLELSKNGELIECASGGLYIRDIHQCNGIAECPDESDEKGCENGICLCGFSTRLILYFTKYFSINRLIMIMIMQMTMIMIVIVIMTTILFRCLTI